MIKIMPCFPCKPGGAAAEFQDATYGRGQRVHSVTRQREKPENQGVRCSVCGTEKR